jgi:hypothetical protein
MRSRTRMHDVWQAFRRGVQDRHRQAGSNLARVHSIHLTSAPAIFRRSGDERVDSGTLELDCRHREHGLDVLQRTQGDRNRGSFATDKQSLHQQNHQACTQLIWARTFVVAAKNKDRSLDFLMLVRFYSELKTCALVRLPHAGLALGHMIRAPPRSRSSNGSQLLIHGINMEMVSSALGLFSEYKE